MHRIWSHSAWHYDGGRTSDRYETVRDMGKSQAEEDRVDIKLQ